jgi:putative SOS response-associated peptidase YedK
VCGRVDIHTPPSQLARALEAQLAVGVDPDGRPSWNVGPSRGVPAVVETDEHKRVLDVFRWGLVPHWAKDPKVGYKMINARAETVASKPAYRTALSRRRCLIVVDAFYEWMAPDPTQPKKKVPYYFRRADGAPITFAGLYETWWEKRSEEPDPETYLQTCVIVTTDAGPDMVPVHDRMPVIIEEANRDRWLDPELHDTHELTGLLVPSPAGTLVRHPVRTEVNSPRNDGPHLIEPAPDPDVQLLLPPGSGPA